MGKLGLDVRLGKRNELLLDGLKISGTASHVYKQRVLHHGTLLFSSEMGILSSALNTTLDRFTDRAVKSVPSKVTNIKDYLSEPLDMAMFQDRILSHILQLNESNQVYQFSETDIKEIISLRDSKFSTWEWNFGYSPKYQFNKSIAFDKGRIELHMNVEKGVIKELKIEGDFTSMKDISSLEELLAGTIHDPETIRRKLSGTDISAYILGLENEELLSGMF